MRWTAQLRRRAAAVAATALLGAGLAVTAGPAPSYAAEVTTPAACSQEGSIAKTLKNGTSWYMCWNVESKKGLVLESVYVKAPNDTGYRKVLDSLALAQLNVPYDSGQHLWNDITSYGFGNQYLQKLDPSECPDGELIDVDQAWLQRSGTNSAYVTRTLPAICVQEVETGLAYRSHEQDWGSIDDDLLFTKQGTSMVVSTISKVDWYEYQSRYEFTDGGVIAPSLGATGDISPEDFADPVYGWPVGPGATGAAATSHHHNAFWRVDFGIDGASTQRARYMDSTSTSTGPRGPILTTSTTPVTAAVGLPMVKRRIYNVYAPTSENADQHPRGYEIVFASNDPYEAQPETTNQVTFTQYNACQEFASQNQNPACALQSVVDYVANSTTSNISNPVAFVNVGFHHLVRDEDQSPMPIHWQGFELVPRDFWAQNPLTPTARECVNGNPGGQVDSTTACGWATSSDVALSAPSQVAGTGTPATATVTVAQLSGTGTIPVGTVSLTDGLDLVASGVPVGTDGTAVVPIPASLAAGEHQLTAVFAPESGTKWMTSASSAAAFTVEAAPVTASPSVTPSVSPSASPSTTPSVAAPKATRTSFSLAKKKIRSKQRARVKVSVSGATTGTVVIYSDGKRIGTAALTRGAAAVQLKKLGVGSHKITVTFVGGSGALSSTAAAKVLKVVK